MYEWDSKNVILIGSKDGVVRVCRNYFIVNYFKLIFFLILGIICIYMYNYIIN